VGSNHPEYHRNNLQHIQTARLLYPLESYEFLVGIASLSAPAVSAGVFVRCLFRIGGLGINSMDEITIVGLITDTTNWNNPQPGTPITTQTGEVWGVVDKLKYVPEGILMKATITHPRVIKQVEIYGSAVIFGVPVFPDEPTNNNAS
jgi:hypothetical protein